MAKIKIHHLYQAELISGMLLILGFLSALFVANHPALEALYRDFVFYPLTIGYGLNIYQEPLIKVVNDGLMTFFFLLIGLELKFHLVRGEFRDTKTLALPTAAAIGGIVFPAAFYLFWNASLPQTVRGWAIPIATDTAFMLGILAFFGKMISTQLRAFIIGFSLIDDAIALMILAVFYSYSESMNAAIGVGIITGVLFLFNRLNIMSTFYYLLGGLFLWIFMVYAGIHGTLAGVVMALMIPVEKNGQTNPSFYELEHILRPFVYYGVLPLFAFINSGVVLADFEPGMLLDPLSLGIVSGLFLGKQSGIMLCSYIAVRLKLCQLPDQVCWTKFYAVAVLGGIGFTLSLFIGDLVFEEAGPNYLMRMSVIIASLLSAVLGVLILLFLQKSENTKKTEAA